ncbi:alkylation response protein AidB-like acyl-CoA dehydrogenase [Streptacidiphilus sp. BW17]|uniref:acyl-CoA dehydrogenase n=1 Tax=Streptacidiphilus sp. BW17 TaxID=3156274 RepID=UPI003514E06E
MTLQPTWTASGTMSGTMSGAAPHARRRAAQARFAEIETAFGDPWDAAAPLGFRALLAADRAGTVPKAALSLTRDLGLAAEFVPTVLGGNLDGVDVLGLLLRPVFRRDVALAVRSVLTSFLAATQVWINGDEEQQRLTADTLRAGGSMAVAFQYFAHAADFAGDEVAVTRTADGGLVFGGGRQVVCNAADADLFVAFARADAANAVTALLVPLRDLRAGGARPLERVSTEAVPGLELRVLAFDDCPLPAAALLGTWGRGVEEGLRAYPVVHAAAPGMLIGVADTALRTAARFAVQVGVAGRPLARVRNARHALAATFVDLLVGDCVSLVAGRALHLLPERCNALAAVATYLVPPMLEEALHHLQVVMGGALHDGGDSYGIFAKHLRDMDAVSFCHVSRAVCQVAIAPCLPGIAADPARSGLAPEALFHPYGALPPLDPQRLSAGGGHDGLAAWFLALPDTTCADDPLDLLLSSQLVALRDEFDEIFAAAAALPDADADAGAGPDPDPGAAPAPDVDADADALALPLVDRYALALAAVCCLGVHRQASLGGPFEEREQPFLADLDWLVTALDRLLRRAGRSTPPVPKEVTERLCAEVLRRDREARSLDLYDLELAG